MLFNFIVPDSQYGYWIELSGDGFFITDRTNIFWIQGIMPETFTDKFLERVWKFAVLAFSKDKCLLKSKD
jgi:hypothetical protein